MSVGGGTGTSDVERAYAIRKFGFEFPVMDKIAVKWALPFQTCFWHQAVCS